MTKLLRTSGDIHIFEKPIAELLKYIVYRLWSAVCSAAVRLHLREIF